MKFIIGSHELNKMLIIRQVGCGCVLTDSDEKVDHEADVEGEVDLLAGVLVVRNAVLNSFPAAKNSEPRFLMMRNLR